MSSMEDDRTSLDGHGIFAIIVFAVVALICIQPIRFPLPFLISDYAQRFKFRLVGTSLQTQTVISQAEIANVNTPQIEKTRRYITFNHVWTPAIGILFLLATKTIGGEQIKLGIVGEEGVEPYDVLALFISLAYIAISLDATGLLRFLAFQVCQKAGSNGFGLYFILYGFFWFLGVIVGNDPVILSGTAFLVHLTRVAGMSPPSAWIWAQFVAANISSAVLVSSNPTNLVIATGFNITFPVYTAYMILPSFVSALVTLCVLLLFFRNRTKPQARQSKRSGKATFAMLQKWTKGLMPSQSKVQRRKSPRNAARGEDSIESIEMSARGTHSRDQQKEERKPPLIYIPKMIIRPDVDARAALVDPKGAIFNSFIMAATLITLIVTSVTGHVRVYMIAAPGAGVCIIRDVCYDWYTWRSTRKHEKKKVDSENAAPPSQVEEVNTSKVKQGSTISVLAKGTTGEKKPYLSSIVSISYTIKEIFPTVSYVFSRLPFPLLPFAFGMFILVQSLSHVGFINIMARGIGKVCGESLGGCAVFMAVLAVILCNLGGTNIGATILLTKAMQSSAFQSQLEPSKAAIFTKVAYFSVAFGSNIGALGGTFAASLAGLLWRDALRQRGILVTKLQFLTWCAVVIVPSLLSGIGILLLEIDHFHL